MDLRTASAAIRKVINLYMQMQREGVDACCGEATGTQCQIITQLGRTGPVTVADLSRKLGLDKGWVSRAVESMAQEGLLVKEPSPTDRRAIMVCMTPVGEQLCCDLNETLEGQAERLLRRIPADRRPVVFEAIQLIEQALLEEAEGRPMLVQLEEE